MHGQIGTSEWILRCGVGGLLLAHTLMIQTMPWLAIVATYPVFTAMWRWDPLYALFQRVYPRIKFGKRTMVRNYGRFPLSIR